MTDIDARHIHVRPMDVQAEARILIVDDDVELTVMLSDYLKAEGFDVSVVFDGESGAAAASQGSYDAVILDIMLPRLSGTEALRRIRQTSSVPVIMLTAKGDNVDRVVGLELGADDYVAKPYYPRELVARLRAILRRQKAANGSPEHTSFGLATLIVDVASRRVQHGDTKLDLTVSEFELLLVLMRAKDRVVTKDELSLQVLGRQRRSYDRSIDVHVSNLRQKLGAGGDLNLETIRGVGYRLSKAL